MHPFLYITRFRINGGGDLPTVRITPCRALEKIRIDFAGFRNAKCQHKRKCTLYKSYMSLFVCMSTKEISLELISDLITATFLLTLCQFIAHQICPTYIFFVFRQVLHMCCIEPQRILHNS